MSTAKSPVFPACWLVAAFVLAACLDASAQTANTAKRVEHKDGTVTMSVSDVEKGELRESTFDGRGVLLTQRIVLLNERGQPVQGVIYNGRDELVGSVRFAYDDLGRVTEEISLNSQGQPFRRKIQQYDLSGKPLTTKIVDYSQNAPSIATNSINFTNVVPPPNAGAAANPAGAQAPKQPGEAPQIQTVSPRSKANKTEEKKRGFFDFLKK
jgi:YD repeat-containing protein